VTCFTSKLCRCSICGLGLLQLALASASLGLGMVGFVLLLGALHFSVKWLPLVSHHRQLNREAGHW